ncbi:MAG: tetratricopeptide repeat protein [Acidobacteriota bacterium]
MIRVVRFVLGAAAVAALFAVFWPREPASLPPASSTFGVLGAVSALDTDKGIRQFETRIEEDPRDFVSQTILGQLYARKAREVGDLALFRRAEEAFQRALRLKADHTPASSFLAAAYASQHKFPEALDLATRLLSNSPGSLDALATLADVYLETGKYTEGEEAVRTLAKQAGGIPAVLARRALVAELRGRNAEAVALLQEAITIMRRDAEPARETAWFETRLADVYFHSGCLERAEAHFTQSLELFPSYPIGLSGLADVRVAQGRLPDAADLLSRAAKVAPEPSTLFDLGAVHAALGHAEDAARAFAAGESVATRRDINAPAHYRTLATYYADLAHKPALALDLAQKDLAVRQDVEAYDTLAWAFYLNGRYDEAAETIGEALKLGTREPGFYYHAGMIYDAQGKRDAAREHLERALDMSPHMFPPDAREALKKLGGRTEAANACNLQS